MAYATARPLWHRVERHPRLARAVHTPLRAAWTRVMPSDPDASALAATGGSVGWPFAVRERRPIAGAGLVIDSQILQFDRNAGDHDMHQYMRVLQDHGHRLTFLPDDRIEREPYTHLLRQAGVEALTGDINVEEWLRVNGPFLDVVLLARPTVAQRYLPLIRRHSRARIVYYTHDLHFLRERRRFEATGEQAALRESEKMLLLERGIFRAVDVVASPSTDEVDEIRALGARQVAIWTPYPDVPASQEDNPVASRDAVLFVGGFAHTPNINAALVLAQEVMPIVWRQLPDVPLLLVGNAPPPQVRALADDRVTVTGYVPDLDPYYARARVSANPLRFGAGLKGKIVSSLAAGVPVVATSIANEGIGLEDGHEALFGETPAELAAHIVRLFSDDALAEEMGRRGRELVMRRFSPEKTTRAVLAAARGEMEDDGAGAP
jgi:glycosyltransferase involved in cell wall biosynthesis